MTNKRADANFQRQYLAPIPVFTLSNTGGGNGTPVSKTYASDIMALQACALNSNPFDTDYCSGWTPRKY
jgi:hypothetical protein